MFLCATLGPWTACNPPRFAIDLPAAGVIAEAMVALVLADALLEKLGGDSMVELKAHWEATAAQQRAWPG